MSLRVAVVSMAMTVGEGDLVAGGAGPSEGIRTAWSSQHLEASHAPDSFAHTASGGLGIGEGHRTQPPARKRWEASTAHLHDVVEFAIEGADLAPFSIRLDTDRDDGADTACELYPDEGAALKVLLLALGWPSWPRRR